MATEIVGPFRTIVSDGLSIPVYLVPFDEHGFCEGPLTKDHLLRALATGGYTDVFLFSHGWNNDWSVATARYEHFTSGFMGMRKRHGVAAPPGYKPILIGVIWPSTALVMPWEEGPQIAAAPSDDRQTGRERERNELAETVSPAARERFYQLTRKTELGPAEQSELCRMLSAGTPEAGEGDYAEELLALWKGVARDSQTEITDFGGPPAGGRPAPRGGPAAAGLLDSLDPRHLLRLVTVRSMKDRAGRVGANGVHDLLNEVLAADTQSRVRLIGHSYGGKVVLSALCMGSVVRQVDSVLLLQPAVSALCFAARVPATGAAGGYRKAFERCRQPLMTTLSSHDGPLHDFFHLALRRSRDLGEAAIAAAGPSQYAALGGYGPQGLGAAEGTVIAINAPPAPYAAPAAGVRVIGLDGTAGKRISGHGDVSNDFTYWALCTQVANRGP